MAGLKGPQVPSREKKKGEYQEDIPHVAPEIVSGKKEQSRKSDIRLWKVHFKNKLQIWVPFSRSVGH